MRDTAPLVTLEWFGCTTFRLRVGDVTLFLDTFLDRPPVGATGRFALGRRHRSDFLLIGHAHFDHLLGANVMAHRTGATVVGSYETVRVMTEAGVPSGQLLPVWGGETVACGPDVRVGVFPACTRASSLP